MQDIYHLFTNPITVEVLVTLFVGMLLFKCRNNYAYNSEGEVAYYTHTGLPGRKNRYVFRYRMVEGYWRAYICSTPCSKKMVNQSSVENRGIENEESYICVSYPITSLDEIIKISRQWAEHRQRRFMIEKEA